MTFGIGHLVPVMGEADVNANAVTGTTTALIAFAALPTNINARCELVFKGSITKNNSGSGDYVLHIEDEASAAFSPAVELTVTPPFDVDDPEGMHKVILCSDELVSHAATDKFQIEITHSSSTAGFGHYCWSPSICVRMR